MDCTLTISYNEETLVINEEDIYSPKRNCMADEEYVARIAEYGVTTKVMNPDGSTTTTKISPHCICTITFDNPCDVS